MTPTVRPRPTTRRFRIRLPHVSVVLVLVGVLLAGCRRDEPPAAITAPEEPVAAVEALAEALRENDVVRYQKLSLPPALYERSQQRWRERLAAAREPTAEEAADYAAVMNRLTAENAETALLEAAEEKLVALEAEIGARWPLVVAMGAGFVNTTISANTELSDSDKQHGQAVVAALQTWANEPTKFTDRDKARQAIAIVTRSARALELPTLDSARALELEPALVKAGTVFAALKQITALYGIDVDAALDGVEAEVLAQPSQDQADVEVRYPLLGQTIAFRMMLERRDGGWYPAEALAEAEREAETSASVTSVDGAPAEPGAR